MLRNSFHILATLMLAFVLFSCKHKPATELSPWGTPMDETIQTDSDQNYTLADILQNGELIALTLSGPETYYEYRGQGMGTQYLLCQQFAQQLGVALRMEVCRDTAELISKLHDGDGDLIALPLPRGLDNLVYCADNWTVTENNKLLADSINHWYKPSMLKQAKTTAVQATDVSAIRRHVYAPMLDRANGIISSYDQLFKRYSTLCGWDWRMIAAQCYQESCFDPNARSWAGASGLMQIMPATADHLNLPRHQLFQPEPNISAACRYIKELEGVFRDIDNPTERQMFVLAAYNGGAHHIRDAMALARKHGQNPQRWNVVAVYVLRLMQPQFYNDPVVRYGYMRGSETVDYVARIFSRYAQYCGTAPIHLPTSGILPQPATSVDGGNASAPTPRAVTGPGVPQKATKKYRFDVE